MSSGWVTCDFSFAKMSMGLNYWLVIIHLIIDGNLHINIFKELVKIGDGELNLLYIHPIPIQIQVQKSKTKPFSNEFIDPCSSNVLYWTTQSDLYQKHFSTAVQRYKVSDSKEVWQFQCAKIKFISLTHFIIALKMY